MVIGAIDEQYVDRRAFQSLSCGKSAKSTADNYHKRSFRRHLFALNSSILKRYFASDHAESTRAPVSIRPLPGLSRRESTNFQPESSNRIASKQSHVHVIQRCLQAFFRGKITLQHNRY